MRKERKEKIIENQTVEAFSSEGKGIVRTEGKVIFVDKAMPGDVVDISIQKDKKSYAEGVVKNLISPSAQRVTPFCIHFGTCGGCKLQHIDYNAQVAFKEQVVHDALQRIGKITIEETQPILHAEKNTFYRNKLDYACTNKRWLTAEEISSEESFYRSGIGFHIPGHFDKVVDIDTCYLLSEISNSIKNEIRNYCKTHKISHYDVRAHEGILRNIIIRQTTLNEIMVCVVFGTWDDEACVGLLEHLKNTFPQITSLLYIINKKVNDTIYDQEVLCFSGNDFIQEKLGNQTFRIGVKSFFQTNTKQAEKLYEKIVEFGGFTTNDIVYDLYTGVGSIALFIAAHCKKVVGVELIEEAIVDAKKNATLNAIENAFFYASDVKDLFNDDFVKTHGAPNVIVVDPPRAGMHEDVVNTLLSVAAPKIVYVSCNPGTQARDLQLLSEKYTVKKSCAADLFPHTPHIENIVLLELK